MGKKKRNLQYLVLAMWNKKGMAAWKAEKFV